VFKELWKRLGRRARIGLIAGTVFVLAVTVAAGYWLLRTDYQVLFANLTPQDAAAVTGELERQKIPYAVSEQDSEGGTTVLVDRHDVYKTRMKVMGKELPLHGAVGFEVFNNSDLGMTEFAQRINYQRALQGELTRTILSLTEIRDARVLLALPEQGLFKQARSKATASITLTMKQGRALMPAQVVGVQRLVAAAVPGIAAQDVTVVDQSGITLSRLPGDGQTDGSSTHLDLKRETEQYLSRKASDVLERALGPGQALASVDVTLDMDRAQTTTEDVVTAPGASGQALQTGVVVRERETIREGNPPMGAQSSAGAIARAAGESSQREVEYAVGRRVANVISQPGSIQRIQVVAVVKKALDANQQEQIRKTVAASVGVMFDRGDAVVVQSMEAMLDPSVAPAHGENAAGALEEAKAVAAPAAPERESKPEVKGLRVLDGSSKVSLILIAGLLVAFGIVRWSLGRRQTVRRPPQASEAERKAALLQVKAWMRDCEAERAAGGLP
jgi:flagellar M-ring protein FliF